jgi:hypothetical protein
MTKLWTIAIWGTCLASLPANAQDNETGEFTPCPPDVVQVLGAQGEWVTVPLYGAAWHPSPMVVGGSFVPYQTGGAWVDRDGTPFFASDWPWGDLVFNSGRWTLDPGQGWLWLPDPGCVNPSPVAIGSEVGPMPVVLFLPATKVRTIKHPADIQFVYRHGQGHVLPARTERPMHHPSVRPTSPPPNPERHRGH